MYGLAGERRLDEWSVPWLPGYQGAAPVRVGNGAAGQLQLDVYGEVMDALHHARKGRLSPVSTSWTLQVNLVEHIIKIWNEPDEGIWEGPRRSPPVHLFQGHGLGGAGPRGEGCGGI